MPEAGGRRARLLAVLLVDALETLGRQPRGDGAREVRGWMCASTDAEPFSFVRACDALGLPATRLRRRVGLRGQTAPRASTRGFLRRATAPRRRGA